MIAGAIYFQTAGLPSSKKKPLVLLYAAGEANSPKRPQPRTWTVRSQSASASHAMLPYRTQLSVNPPPSIHPFKPSHQGQTGTPPCCAPTNPCRIQGVSQRSTFHRWSATVQPRTNDQTDFLGLLTVTRNQSSITSCPRLRYPHIAIQTPPFGSVSVLFSSSSTSRPDHNT